MIDMKIKFILLFIFFGTWFSTFCYSQTTSITFTAEQLKKLDIDLKELDYLRAQSFNKNKLIAQQDSIITYKDKEIELISSESKNLDDKIKLLDQKYKINIDLLKSCDTQSKDYYDQLKKFELDNSILLKQRKRARTNNVILSSIIVVSGVILGAIAF